MLKFPTIMMVKRTRRGVGVGQAQQLEALRRKWDGLVSRVLLHGGDVFDARMTVTSVDVGSRFGDRKSTRLNSSHANISYAVFCLKKKKILTRKSKSSAKCSIL